MIFTRQTAMQQIEELVKTYPLLHIAKSDSQQIKLSGRILIHRSIPDFVLRKEYALDVIIPIGIEKVPFVIDSEKEIDRSYEHVYPNGRLCLETEIAIHNRFRDGLVLTEWMRDFVEPYYMTYEYYQVYGEYPFGERSHGIEGIIESYQEVLNTPSSEEAYRLLCFIVEHSYRGHLRCPCESGKRIRNCHGKYMEPFYCNEAMKLQLEKDIELWEKHREKKTKYNSITTKRGGNVKTPGVS